MYMEIISLVLLSLTFAETSLLLAKSRRNPLIRNEQKRKVYIDTSALMDSRLLSVAATGFIGDQMIVPRSVINELQILADGKDPDKRARARAGLDAVHELERVVFFDTTILDDELDHTPVDNRLLELAKTNHGLILTNDFNLEKVAATAHIDTLNLNNLALALRSEYFPGEQARLKIVTTGSGIRQGVGYLRDGTMVVVEKADRKIGQEVTVRFIRINQSASGTMMFAELVKESSPNRTTTKSSSKVTTKKSSPKKPVRRKPNQE